MSVRNFHAPVNYVADLSHVREVSLLGAADLAFWKEQLRPIDLLPTEVDGNAQLVLSATESKFRGIPFRELIIAVCAYDVHAGARRDGFFLAHAFNSSRLLAWCERQCFSTPYDHGNIQVEVGPPASFQLIQDGESLIRAAMAPGAGAPPRPPSQSGDEQWEGPIFLPRTTRRASSPCKVFFAKLGGHTEAFAFDPSRDALAIRPSPSTPALAWLLDSGFTSREWLIRAAARHARSKTYRRS